MARPSNTEQRKEQIIYGLQTVMAEKGYEKASTQAIAKAAGLSPGLIHYHFKTKQEILIELVRKIKVFGEQRYEKLCIGKSSAQERLDAFIGARLATGGGADLSIVATWVVIGAEAVRQPEVQKIYQQTISEQLDLLTELLRESAKEVGKELPKKAARDLAATLLATMEGVFQFSAAAEPEVPQSYAEKTVKSLVAAYFSS
jgi:TetR/AcrR family transcriptional repressor of bet genes